MRRSLIAIAAALWLATSVNAQSVPAPGDSAPSPRAADIFRRFSDRVVKVQVVEKGSVAKTSLGSGFFVDDSGTIVTNYHVVARLVHRPGRYRIEALVTGAQPRAAEVIAIDVVHDLAIVRTGLTATPHFTLSSIAPARGARLYALGHPKDLGLSIVEGTYNGLLQFTLYPKVHFTGSLNPGMSGGPAVDEAGRVVGINVSTEGEQVSFLVPVDRARELLEKARAPGYTPPKDQLAEVASQIRSFQDAYLKQMLSGTVPTITLGEFVLPTAPESFFKCWADAPERSNRPYTLAYHRCSTDDALFITDEQSAGVVELQHRYLTSKELNAFRFSALYSYQFSAENEEPYGDEEFVTKFRCTTDNVRHQRVTVRAAFCVRRYRKMPGLYDAVMRSVVLGGDRSGVLTVLELSGVTFENAQLLSRRYLESIAWQRR